MGSIVKSIGRVFKGIGKTLKKIAPILLVAAAVYVGYGFASGFTGAGWPTITSWGKSLMGGVTSGNSLSQAASVATQEAPAAAAAQTAQTVTEASSSGLAPVAQGVGTATGAQPQGVTEGMLGSLSGNAEAAKEALGYDPSMMGSSRLGGLNDGASASTLQLGGHPEVPVSRTFNPRGMGGAAAAIAPTTNAAAATTANAATATTAAANPSFNTFDLSTLTGTGPGLESLGTRSVLSRVGNVTGVPAGGTSFTWQDAIISFKGKASEAWKWYKELWKSDPLIALMGTNQVIALIADLMEKEEVEKEFGGMSAEEFGYAMNKYSPGPSALTVGEVQQKYGRGRGGMIGAGRTT